MHNVDLTSTDQEIAVQVGFKAYLNSFPKSGTHLVNLMLATLCSPALGEGAPLKTEDPKIGNWSGNLIFNGWGTKLTPNHERMKIIFEEMPEGTFIKGHAAYTKELENMLLENQIAGAFLYRDLRDVAVSQAYHVLEDNDDRFVHPGKEVYQALPDFESVLIAVIEGLDDYPGLLERWELFAPWFDINWIIKLRYEDILEKPYEQSKRLILYLFYFLSYANNLDFEVLDTSIDSAVEAMVSAMGRKDLSPTFRKGGSGGWKNYFTKPVIDAFKHCDKNNWLERLGFKWV
jgi:hypothetical protein